MTSVVFSHTVDIYDLAEQLTCSLDNEQLAWFVAEVFYKARPEVKKMIANEIAKMNKEVDNE